MRKARLIRNDRGLAPGPVYIATGIDPSQLSKFERGIGSLGLGRVKALAKFYGVTIDELLADVPDPEPAAKGATA